MTTTKRTMSLTLLQDRDTDEFAVRFVISDDDGEKDVVLGVDAALDAFNRLGDALDAAGVFEDDEPEVAPCRLH